MGKSYKKQKNLFSENKALRNDFKNRKNKERERSYDDLAEYRIHGINKDRNKDS